MTVDAASLAEPEGWGRARRYAPLGVKLAITIALLAYLFSRIGTGAVLRVLATSHWSLAALSTALLTISFFLGGLRWRYVLRSLDRPVPLGRLVRLFWVGALAAQVLPNPFGDAVRIGCALKHGLPLGVAIRSTIVERVVMIVSLILLACLTEPLLPRLGIAVPRLLLWALLALALLGTAALMLGDILLPARLAALKPVAPIRALSLDLRRFVASPWSLPAYAAAFLSYGTMIACAAILGSAVGLSFGFGVYLAIIPITTMAMIVPISIGGWGLREGVLTALLGAIGVPADYALAFSIMMGVSLAVASLPGIVFLWLDSRLPPVDRQASPAP